MKEDSIYGKTLYKYGLKDQQNTSEIVDHAGSVNTVFLF